MFYETRSIANMPAKKKALRQWLSKTFFAPQPYPTGTKIRVLNGLKYKYDDSIFRLTIESTHQQYYFLVFNDEENDVTDERMRDIVDNCHRTKDYVDTHGSRYYICQILDVKDVIWKEIEESQNKWRYKKWEL